MDKLTRQRKKAGKLGGSATTRAKRKASAANGSLGGRPDYDPNTAAFAIVGEAERLTQRPQGR
jgi:hypothetical protein